MYAAVPRMIPWAVIAGLVIVGEFIAPAFARARRVEGLGQPEVQHLDDAVGAHFHVGGLQIAMDDPLRVRGFQGIGDLARDGERVTNADGV